MQESNILLYETEDGDVNVDVILKDETIWLTQKSMAEEHQIMTMNDWIKETDELLKFRKKSILSDSEKI